MSTFNPKLQAIVNKILKEYEEVNEINEFKALNEYIVHTATERILGKNLNSTFEDFIKPRIQAEARQKQKQRNRRSVSGYNKENNDTYANIKNILGERYGNNESAVEDKEEVEEEGQEDVEEVGEIPEQHYKISTEEIRNAESSKGDADLFKEYILVCPYCNKNTRNKGFDSLARHIRRKELCSIGNADFNLDTTLNNATKKQSKTLNKWAAGIFAMVLEAKAVI